MYGELDKDQQNSFYLERYGELDKDQQYSFCLEKYGELDRDQQNSFCLEMSCHGMFDTGCLATTNQFIKVTR
jgi:hypothetical protein